MSNQQHQNSNTSRSSEEDRIKKEQEEYYRKYSQYGYVSQTTNSTNNDAYYYNYYQGQGYSGPGANGNSAASSYEFDRSLRQMNHYFDVSTMPLSQPQQTKSKAEEASPKPTAAQIKFYKEQKEKRKRVKNKWLYE